MARGSDSILWSKGFLSMALFGECTWAYGVYHRSILLFWVRFDFIGQAGVQISTFQIKIINNTQVVRIRNHPASRHHSRSISKDPAVQ